MIQIKKPNEVKKVVKPWGYELWMADKSNSKFALKKFLLRRHINQVFNFTKPKRKVYLLLVEKVDYITLMIKSILKNLKKIYIQKKKSIALLRV